MKGLQYQRANTSAAAELVTSGSAVLFDATALNSNIDSNISYAGGDFTFASGGEYSVSWFVNTQSGVALDINFELEVYDAGNVLTETFGAESIFKTGQTSGFALISVLAGGYIRLVNASSGTVTLAIGNGIVTAGLAIMGVPDVYGTQAYSSVTTVGADAIIPYNASVNAGGVTINTNGTITFTAAGTYIFDWWANISSANGATEAILELRSYTIAVPTPVTIANTQTYAPMSVDTQMYGHAVVVVTPADIAQAGFNIGLYNVTQDQTPLSVALNLSPTTQTASIRVLSNAAA